ncbi:MAG: NOG1 family protein [Halobacteriaceae archaeon]
MEFEDLPRTPTADELVDQAFSRAARAGRAKSGVDAQESMLLTASNVLHDNLENVVHTWPDVDALHPFYRELADALVGVDPLREHLSEISWAAGKTRELGRDHIGRLPADPESARSVRQQGFARMASVVEEVADDLDAVGEARDTLVDLPDIRPDEPAIVVAGLPNVGKSSFVNRVTRASNEVASYPFTTEGVHVGHVERNHVTYQIVDTPGMLDRPERERNDVEAQAASALTHLADVVVVILDASGQCGYPLDDQRSLLADVEARFDVPVIAVCNKADLSRDVEADHYMSVSEGENVEAVLDAAIDAVGYEPDLPFDQ